MHLHKVDICCSSKYCNVAPVSRCFEICDSFFFFNNDTAIHPYLFVVIIKDKTVYLTIAVHFLKIKYIRVRVLCSQKLFLLSNSFTMHF